jgi:hypothetical protein
MQLFQILCKNSSLVQSEAATLTVCFEIVKITNSSILQLFTQEAQVQQIDHDHMKL